MPVKGGFGLGGRGFRCNWLAASLAGAAGLALLGLSSVAMAAPGQPEPWQFLFQDAVTPVADEIHWFNNMLLVIVTAITAFVLGLLLYVVVRFNSRANPTPSHFHHNTLLEVAWTVIPILILVFIAVPSFRLLYTQYSYPKPDLTIKAIGNQWYWSYQYPDIAEVKFDSLMLKDDVTKAMRDKGQQAPRLLAVDNEVVVPIDKNVLVLVTANDVIHSWTVPSFGVKTDGVPGRITATWFRATKPGIYYGVCSELCGVDHGFMPIAVRVVPQQVFDAWVAIRKAGGKDVDDKARAAITASLESGVGKVAQNVPVTPTATP